MGILSYIFSQFISLCKASSFKLMIVRNKVRGKSAYLFLEEVLEVQSTLKLLLKKIISNQTIQELFRDLVQSIDTEFELPSGPTTEYFYDFLLISVLNQVWVQIVYEPFAKDICYGLNYEI
jgi:hypothetical protein